MGHITSHSALPVIAILRAGSVTAQDMPVSWKTPASPGRGVSEECREGENVRVSQRTASVVIPQAMSTMIFETGFLSGLELVT